MSEQSGGETDRSATGENVACPACGCRTFELRAIDEHDTEDRSIYAFCSNCGNATGKMWNRSVDNRLVDTDQEIRTDGGIGQNPSECRCPNCRRGKMAGSKFCIKCYTEGCKPQNNRSDGEARCP